MAFDIYRASVPLVKTNLKCIKAVLDKARVYAEENKIAEDVWLNYRIAPDMFPLLRQVQIVTDNAKGIGARLAGVDVPSFPDDETTLDALVARIDKTIAFVDGLEREKFVGAEDREVVLKLGKAGEMTFDGAGYLTQFALPNFYFHATTTYAILRHIGVPLTKADFLRPPG